MDPHERYLFDTLGYLVVPDVLDAGEVAELNRHLDDYDLWARAERGELEDLWSNDSRFISGGRPHTWDPPFRRLIEHPTILGYLRELYQVPGVADTVDMGQIKRHYYATHERINPTRIVPKGPDQDLTLPHGRDGVG